MKKQFLRVNGATPEGKPVIGGVFALYETHGVPLDVIIGLLAERNSVPDWMEFYRAAKKAGIDHRKIVMMLRDAAGDALGPEWAEAVEVGIEKRTPR